MTPETGSDEHMTQANDDAAANASDDPVVARRRRAAQWAKAGKRLGYLLFSLAIVLFVVAMVTDLPRSLTVAIVVSMAIGSLVLAPAIVVSYGVKAADREDRERSADNGPAGPRAGGV